MNIVILILMCVSAYALNELFSYVDQKVTEWEEFDRMREIRKKYKGDLYRHKINALFREAKRVGLNCGYSPKQAEAKAINFLMEVKNNGLIDNKYQLLKERA